MRFFLIHTDPLYTNAPDLVAWQDKVSKRFVRQGFSYNIPKREIYFIRPNTNTVFTDIVSFPFFIVRQQIRDVIKMYEPKLVYKEFVLLDKVNKLSEVYYLPILKEIHCLSEKSELTIDRSVIKHGIINEKLLCSDESIFFIGGMKNTYVAARLDIVESLLRRGAFGIGLTPLDTICE